MQKQMEEDRKQRDEDLKEIARRLDEEREDRKEIARRLDEEREERERRDAEREKRDAEERKEREKMDAKLDNLLKGANSVRVWGSGLVADLSML